MGSKRRRKIAILAGPRSAAKHGKARPRGRPDALVVPGPLFGGLAHFASAQERRDAGKALRDKVPRDVHATWKRSNGVDPLAILRASDTGREPVLVPIRYGRMLASPFTFYRGAAAVMAADLAKTPANGERVQACGDCHLMNFGGFATPERNIIFDINDFDETLPGPWEWDVKRLAASFVLAARGNGLSEAKARDLAVTCARSYRKHLAAFADMNPLSVWYARITVDDFVEGMPKAFQKDVRAAAARAMKRTPDTDFPKLADMVGGRLGIRDTPPLIFHHPETRVPDFLEFLEKLLAAYRQSLADDRRRLLDQYKPVDAAIKVVGIGSVGRRCWVVLLMSASNDPLFLQVKEAAQSVMEPFVGRSLYRHHGERIVIGQKLMQPASDVFLGWVTGTKGRQFYVRQLRDAKIKPIVETMDAGRLTVYAERCGWSLARAHSKAADTNAIVGYLGKSDRFDEAIGRFARSYADQTERDHAALKAAVRKGHIAVHREV